MSTELKLHLGRKIVDALAVSINCTPAQLLPIIQVGTAQTSRHFELNISLKNLKEHLGSSTPNLDKFRNIKPDHLVREIKTEAKPSGEQITFAIDRNAFVKDTLEKNYHKLCCQKPKSVVIDFSSPNVAKPFHMGHLRSTIIGNFVGNLNGFLNNKVTKLNYLGDWGTQFGFVKVGVDELKYTPSEIRDNPMKLLYNSYIHANKLGEGDAKIAERARDEFNKLESGVPTALSYWKEYVEYSKTELESIYERLGVEFNEYHYESMYSAEKIKDIVDNLKSKGIIQKDPSGKFVVDISEKHKATVVKSDGSTLYLTRDIAAAVDRYEKYDFDKMLYVVDNSQSAHFTALKHILSQMGKPWFDRLHHVRYGRIRGMSTRKGQAVFLKDVLDECRELMTKKQVQSPTTKVAIHDTDTSDILSVSCVIVNDLKQRRQKDYEFNMDKVLQVHGDSGVKLQYTHCRLCNIEKNSGAKTTEECVPGLLEEPEVTILVQQLARFHDVLYEAHEELEACVLVTYLFHLCNHISKAIKILNVKQASSDVAAQRLLLFQKSRDVLGAGMRILGLKPLTEM